jgi:hypothetical protein
MWGVEENRTFLTAVLDVDERVSYVIASLPHGVEIIGLELGQMKFEECDISSAVEKHES